MTIILCLLSFAAGGAAYYKAQKLIRPPRYNAETFAALLEKAAHKFLTHANRGHIGNGKEYVDDLNYAKKFMAEAQRIRHLDEEGQSFLQLTDGKHA